MCKHILNAQVYINSPCCNKWFECSECHDEVVKSHLFKFNKILRLTCKNCKGCFTRDLQIFSTKDKKCDYCGNVWCLPGITPEKKAYDECNSSLESSMSDLIDPMHDYFNEILSIDLK
mmetsp:Transcript_25424/g.24317  ORF Transcript_25424/g.24317 Transcript_25424/m.24317 type:complete len:118 (+) Transcript_25424:3062-3415(+)